VYALILSAESLNKADDPLGQLFNKWVPAARTMSKKKNLCEKYLPKLFVIHLS
jgi:DNA gyrase inhibitor GyrI